MSLRLPFAEVELPYGARLEGSESKLNSIRDGARIAFYIARLLKNLRPMAYFGSFAIAAAGVGLLLGLPVVFEFFETGLVARFPTAFAAASVVVIAAVSFTSALALDAVAMTQREQKRLVYLSIDRWRKSRIRDSG